MKRIISLSLAFALSGIPQISLAAARVVAPNSAPGIRIPSLPAPMGLGGYRYELNSAAIPTAAPNAAVPIHESLAVAVAQIPAEKLAKASPEQARGEIGAMFHGQAPAASLSVAVPSAALGDAVSSLAPAASAPGPRDHIIPPSGNTSHPKKPFFVRHYWLIKLAAYPILKLAYSLKVVDRANIPKGPVLMIANHVSTLDAAILAVAADRPMRWVMKRSYFEKAPRLFRALGAIPVSPRDTLEQKKAALAAAASALQTGESVVIFPEGAISVNGGLQSFRGGFERIAEASGAPVVPAHLDGLYGSAFSLRPEPTFWERIKSEFRRPLEVRFGAPLATADSQSAREAVQELSAAAMGERIRRRGLSLPREFFRTAKRHWKKAALSDSSGKALSFGETLIGSVLLAELLKSRVGRAERVGVLVPPSVGGALANVALASIGRVPVNLNYTGSLEATTHAMKTSGADVIVTSRKFMDALKEKGAAPPPPGSLVFLEDLLPLIPKWKKLLAFLGLRFLPRALGERLYFGAAAKSLDEQATILFTSGSSALPKGVELTQMNLRSNIEMVSQAFAFDEKDSMLGVLPFFHSFGYTVTLWLPLVLGIGAAYHNNPLEMKAIAALAEKRRPTVLLGTPTFLQRYTRSIDKAAFSSLRIVVAGAEKLTAAVADAFEKKFGPRPFEGYGATELSPVASVNLPDAPGQRGNKPGSVGRPLPGTVVRVIDPETGESLPYGKTGMLLVKGPHVMKGYFGEPAKTGEAVKDGWYISGDLAFVDREGFVTLAGRLSRFSKIAGEMVSHVLVEEKLHAAAGATDLIFAVASVPDENRGERLVVLYAGWEGDIDALTTKAKALGLPGIAVPGVKHFHKVDAIPVLGTGKLDLKAVKELAARLEL